MVIRRLFISVSLALVSIPVHAQHRFTVKSLGNVPNGTISVARAINDRGQIVGWSTLPGGATHAFLYRDGAMIDLTPDEVGNARAIALNASGVVVGTIARPGMGQQGVVWKEGTSTLLQGRYLVMPTGINDRGWVVGNSYRVVRTRQYSTPLLWRLNPLGTYDVTVIGNPDANAWASGINNTPKVGGHVLNGIYNAIMWSAWDSMELGGLGDENYVSAISPSGKLVGTFLGNDQSDHAYLWDSTGFTALPDLGMGYSAANAINRANSVVGVAQSQDAANNNHAVMWEGGVVKDLNDLVPPASGWLLRGANGINSSGQIVGYGDYQGHTSAFLLTPAAKLRLSTDRLFGSQIGEGTVTLGLPAGPGGVTVALSSSNRAAVLVIPASVTIPEGEQVAKFYVSTDLVAVKTAVAITATSSEDTQVARLTVRPLMAELTLSQSTAVGRVDSPTGRLTLGAPAPSGGVTIDLASSRGAVAATPDQVFIPAGSTSATFPITTTAVRVSWKVALSARLGGQRVLATLTVNP